MFAVGHLNRSRGGALAADAPIALPVRCLAPLLGLSVGATHKAIAELVVTKRLSLITRSSGRRPACYHIANHYTRHERLTPFATARTMVKGGEWKPGPRAERNCRVSVPTVNARV